VSEFYTECAEGLPLLHSLCLLFNNGLKLSKLAAPVMKRFILNSFVIKIMYKS